MRTTWACVLVLGLLLTAAAPIWGQGAAPIPLALGDPGADLVFSPVAPCRIVDTRLAGGTIAGNTQRSFVVSGVTDFEAQGGNPGGCAIPEGAAAVVVNFVAVNPAGPGDLRAWAFGGPTPNASVLNYAPVSGLNIANGVVAPLCAPGPCAFDLTVQADVSATELVADVLGFFRPFADGVISTETPTLEMRVSGQGALRLEAADGSFGSGPNLVGGFSGNTVAPGVMGATIAGGGSSQGCGGPCLNQVTGNVGTVGGGLDNTASGFLGATVGGGIHNTASGAAATVGGGDNNTASQTAATVSGGANNTASGSSATVGGGSDNTASDAVATVGGGSDNTASAIAATVPGGARASASLFGQMAYASGRFSTNGDAQTSLFVLRRTTTNATQTELFLDGNGGSQRITLANGRTMTFDILVTARSIAPSPILNQSAGYQIRGVIKNVGGTTSLVGILTPLVLAEDDAAWDATVVADNATDALSVRVTGVASTTIRWVAVVRTAEVTE
jgi:hypothetical protein